MRAMDSVLYFFILLSMLPYIYFFVLMTTIAVTEKVYFSTGMLYFGIYILLFSFIAWIWNIASEPECQPLLTRFHITEEFKIKRRSIKIIMKTFSWSLVVLSGITIKAYPHLYYHQVEQSLLRWAKEDAAFTQSITPEQYKRAEEGKAGAILWVVEHHPDESWRLKPLIDKGNDEAMMLDWNINSNDKSKEADTLLHEAAAQGNEQALHLIYKAKVATHN